MLERAIEVARKEGKTEISGKEAFVLYDTYGFPLDLTQLILKENEMTLDQAGFDSEMAQQKQRARNAAAVETTDWVILREGEQTFVGYDETATPAQILRYRKVKQKNKEYYQIILNQTPFYAEMGGQVGDRGTLTDGDEVIEIFDTKRENGVGVHLTHKLPTNLEATFEAAIDQKARLATSCNHTATHLLHQALRTVLGTHVEQKGSYVTPELLRFDFSHFQKVTPEELVKVERLANSYVRKALARDEHRNVPIEKARAMGAMALFGEKYGDEVRVIRYGESVELCGGTHVDNTGNIGMIKILSESSIAAGIRRIEAITGEKVENQIYELQDVMHQMGEMLHNAPDMVVALRKSIEENASLRQQAEEFMKERVEQLAQYFLENAKVINGVKVVVMTGVRVPDIVKNVAFQIRTLSPENTAFVGATVDMAGKPLLTVMLTNDVVATGKNASAMVREAAKAIKGGGGGQPGFAQAGGKEREGLATACETMVANF
jgi:alanyl-tRNA synthetase